MKSCLLYIVCWSSSQMGANWESKFTGFRKGGRGRTEKMWARFWKEISQLQLLQSQGVLGTVGWVVSHPLQLEWEQTFTNPHPSCKLILPLHLLFCTPGGTEGIKESLVEQQEKQWGCPWAEGSVQAVVTALSAELSCSKKKNNWNNTCYNHCKMLKVAGMQHRGEHNLEDAISRMCPSLICSL